MCEEELRQTSKGKDHYLRSGQIVDRQLCQRMNKGFRNCQRSVEKRENLDVKITNL